MTGGKLFWQRWRTGARFQWNIFHLVFDWVYLLYFAAGGVMIGLYFKNTYQDVSTIFPQWAVSMLPFLVFPFVWQATNTTMVERADRFTLMPYRDTWLQMRKRAIVGSVGTHVIMMTVIASLFSFVLPFTQGERISWTLQFIVYFSLLRFICGALYNHSTWLRFALTAVAVYAFIHAPLRYLFFVALLGGMVWAWRSYRQLQFETEAIQTVNHTLRYVKWITFLQQFQTNMPLKVPTIAKVKEKHFFGWNKRVSPMAERNLFLKLAFRQTSWIWTMGAGIVSLGYVVAIGNTIVSIIGMAVVPIFCYALCNMIWTKMWTHPLTINLKTKHDVFDVCWPFIAGPTAFTVLLFFL